MSNPRPGIYDADVDEMTGAALAALEKVRERLDAQLFAYEVLDVVDDVAAEFVNNATTPEDDGG